MTLEATAGHCFLTCFKEDRNGHRDQEEKCSYLFLLFNHCKAKMPKMVPSTAWIKLLHLFRQCCSMSFPKAWVIENGIWQLQRKLYGWILLKNWHRAIMILFSNLPNIIMYGKKLILKRWRNLTSETPAGWWRRKTHLCIRLAKGQHRFLAVHESNHYGISIKCIIDYLNAKFKQYSEECNDNYLYTLIHEIMPGDDFWHLSRKLKLHLLLRWPLAKMIWMMTLWDLQIELISMMKCKFYKNRERPRNSRKIW